MADYDAGNNQQRMSDALTPFLDKAKELELLRPDLTGADILMACRMLASYWKLYDEAYYDAAVAKRLALIIRGLHAG